MPTVKKGKAIRYASENALVDPVPTGKAKVLQMREELWVRVNMHLQQIEQECMESVNFLASVRKQSSFVRLDKKKTPWGQYGPIQGNTAKHIDALAGVVYGYMECIELLDEILGDDSIARRNANSGKDQGSEEAPQGGSAEAAPEEQGRRQARRSGPRQGSRSSRS